MATANQSFANIGKIGGLEATAESGKHWLAHIEEPWLVIINNADDPSLNLPDLFPEGERGHILVNTRNPEFRIHETVGYEDFKVLKKMRLSFCYSKQLRFRAHELQLTKSLATGLQLLSGILH